MNFIKRYKEKKEAERISAREKYQAEKESEEKDILKATEAMLNKPCPFNNMGNCFRECVHFKEGFTFYMVGVGHFPGGWNKHHSRCKLWQNR